MTLEKDTAGQVTVLAANTAQLNTLRTEILGRILEQVEQLDSQELGSPSGKPDRLCHRVGLGSGTAGTGVDCGHTDRCI